MTLAAVGAIQAFLYLLFIQAIDLYDREPLRYVIPVFVWGFTVAAVTTLIFNFILAATLATTVTKSATRTSSPWWWGRR